ncbi:methyltransferase [Actinomadura sp. KC345]|uniref:methyltransferase n=1 Tax=Actinomadura sp. KC345 TaxID=2530371 RepID=UPI001049BFC4|nr:methyltransferase [Actinomadura sp. KC345]TDC44801.1 methyltransferase [Actinomadura sp. KC345]
MKGSPPDPGSGRNDQFSWEKFDPELYVENNYAVLRADDSRIIHDGSEWFNQSAMQRFSRGQGRFRHGVDVGAGPNLYPALMMLGVCRKVTLFEFSSANVAFLKRQVRELDDSWEPFWRVISPFVGNYDFEWVKRAMRERVEVVQGNIFGDLPKGEFDIGTMYFVAESLTAVPREVRHVFRNFLRSLAPESPFAMATMEGSEGYYVGDQWFPAAPLGAGDVDSMLDLLAAWQNVVHVAPEGPSVHRDREGNPVDDHGGFVAVTGVSY